MLNFSENACRVVAADACTTFSDVDDAYVSTLRMAADLVETFKGSGLPAGQSQKIHELMIEGADLMIKGRRRFVSVTGRLQAMASQSNVSEVSFGCPGGIPFITDEPASLPDPIGQEA